MTQFSHALSAIALLGVSCNGLADTVELPHTFESGTPARAADVNENFETLAEVVNATSAALQELEGASLQPIGTLQITGAPYDGTLIPVHSFAWEGSLDASGGGAASVSFGDVSVGKPSDLFSPSLLSDLTAGRTLDSAHIELTSPDGVVTTYVLSSLRVATLNPISVEGSGMLLDVVSFGGFDRLTITTTDPATNGEATYCFDVSSHVQC